MDELEALLGQKMQKIREAHDLSQREIAEQLSLDGSTLSRLETGRSRWYVATLIRYCSVLQVDPAEVLQDLLSDLPERSSRNIWENET